MSSLVRRGGMISSKLTYLQRSQFHIVPGGPQNLNSPRYVRRHLKAFLTRIRRVGFIRTMKELNFAHEINYGETLGTLRGIDEFGNQYYENLDNQFGRHRWVNFAEIRRENSSASSIPPGWWGWLHHSKANTPADPESPKMPKWVLLHAENYTGTDKAYLPTNYGQNTSSAWKKLRYESWDPNADQNEDDAEENLPRLT